MGHVIITHRCQPKGIESDYVIEIDPEDGMCIERADFPYTNPEG